VDYPRRFDAIQVGHGDVHQHHAGIQLQYHPFRLAPGAYLAHHLDLAGGGEQGVVAHSCRK